MDLLRLQLGMSAIADGLAKLKVGQTDDGLRLIEKGFACLQGLLSDVEAQQRAA